MASKNIIFDIDAADNELVDFDALLEDGGPSAEGTGKYLNASPSDEVSQTCADNDYSEFFDQNADGDTKLHVSIIDMDSKKTMEYIDKAQSAPELLSISNSLFQTPLHLAVLTGQVEVVRRLVQAGANSSARDRNGDSALNVACREGETAIVAAIIDASKPLESEPDRPMTRPRSTADWKLANYEGITCIHLAAKHGHYDILKMLVNAGADVNVKETKTGRSVLHTACLDGNFELVQILLDVDSCNTNALTYDGLTPFELARARGHEDICILLAGRVDKGGGVDVLNLDNESND